MNDGLIIAGDGPRPFKCPQCVADFEWGSQLQEHRAAVHLLRPASTPTPSPRQPSYRQIFRCPHCPAAYLSNYYLNVHFNDVHRHPCPLEGCAALFVTSAYLQSHILTAHPNEKKFERHVKGHDGDHGVRKRFRCPHCPKTFLGKQHYKNHVNAVHLDGGHKCPVQNCRHSSLTATLARAHLTRHSNRKDFVCGRCPKAYRRRSSLMKHVTNVHEGHEEKDDDDEVQIIEEEEGPKIISVVSLSEQSKSCC